MSICEPTFKGISNFRDCVIDLLNKHIFANSHYQLWERYIQMEAYCNDPFYYSMNWNQFERPYYQTQINLDSFFTSPDDLWKENNLGHDLPVWINAGDIEKDQLFQDIKNTKNLANEIYKQVIEKKVNDEQVICKLCTNQSLSGKTVMLVGIDPMRIRQRSGVVSLSSPWGIHSKEYRSKGTSNLIWKLISLFNDDNWNVYITDRNKLYVDIYNNEDNHRNQLNIIDKSFWFRMLNCLVEEIENVSPDIIIFMGGGNSFRNGKFLDIFNAVPTKSSSIKFFHIPHPARGGWAGTGKVYVFDPSSNTWK